MKKKVSQRNIIKSCFDWMQCVAEVCRNPGTTNPSDTRSLVDTLVDIKTSLILTMVSHTAHTVCTCAMYHIVVYVPHMVQGCCTT